MTLGLLPTLALAAAAITVATAVFVYWFDRRVFNACMVALATALACGLCLVGLRLGKSIGLAVAVLLVAFLAYRLGSTFGKRKELAQNRRRGGAFVLGLWLWFCASVAIGYWAHGALGLLTITLPSLVLFWASLMAIAQYLFPLSEEEHHFRQQFRSLVTFNLGTNYEYFVLEGDGSAPRVPGNRFGMFLAGPGIVLNDPAHAAVMWEGNKFKQVAGPGFSFTGRFDALFEPVDLRPQLRTLPVEVVTLDGIRIRVDASVVFRVDPPAKLTPPGSPPAHREPAVPGSFPLDPQHVYAAVWRQPIEGGRKRTWDQAVPIVVTQELRRILGRYPCDSLCGDRDDDDPRSLIRSEWLGRITAELANSGIELLTGWIGNLEPVDGDVIAKRIEAWRAAYQGRITAQLGRGQAAAVKAVEEAYAGAHAGLLHTVGHALARSEAVDADTMTRMAALRFIEALDEMAVSPQVREELPADTSETLGYIRRLLK